MSVRCAEIGDDRAMAVLIALVMEARQAPNDLALLGLLAGILPSAETVRHVRFVGLTPKLFYRRIGSRRNAPEKLRMTPILAGSE